MASEHQPSMFESDTSTAVLPLPEHLNYGIHDRGMHRLPGIHGLHYHPGFLDEQDQHVLIERIDAKPWRTDLERRVQHYGWRYDYRARTVTPDMDLGPLPDWVEEIAARLYTETHLFDRVPDQAIVNEYQPGRESPCTRIASASVRRSPPYRWAMTGKCACGLYGDQRRQTGELCSPEDPCFF